MRIKTQFLMSMIIFGVILSIIAASVLSTNQQLESLTRQEGIAIDIERGADELSYLSNQYLLYREDRQLAKWEAKWSSVSNHISALDPNNSEQQVIVDDIKKNKRRLKAVFSNVVSTLQDSSQNQNALADRSFTQVSWGRIAVQNQGIASDALRLTQIIRDHKDRLRQMNNLLIFALLGAFSVYFITNYLIVQRRLLRSVAHLQAGTEVIGSGNLDFALEVKRNDEIGELSQAFNRMAADLKGVTASKAELEREIAERKAAERALYAESERLSVTLASIGDGVIATDTEANVVLLNGVAENLTGWTQEEAVGRPLREVFNIINEVTRQPAEDPVDKALETGLIVGLANHTALIAKDGTEISIADSCAPIRAQDGTLLGAVLVFRDVTEERRAEEERERLLGELEKSNKETSALLESASAIVRHQEFDIVAREIFDACKGLIGATAGYISLLSSDETENEVLFLDSGGLSCTVDPTLPMPIRGLRGEAHSTGKTVYDNNFSDSDWQKFMPEGHVKLDNVLFAPLVIEGNVVGLLGIANKPGGFNENDARMASAFAENAAVALHNSRLLDSLRNSEERFRSVAQTASDAIISADSSGNIIFWNEAAEIIFGYSADETVGRSLTSIMPERFHKAHQDGLNRLVLTGKSNIVGQVVELVGLKKDGSEFPLELSLASWKTKEGTFFTGILRDITERKHIQKALDAERERLSVTLASIGDGVIATDIQANVVLLNGVAEKLTGWKQEEAEGRPLLEVFNIINEITREPAGNPVDKALKTGVIVGLANHTALIAKDDTERSIADSCAPIRSLDGTIIGAVLVFRDVTEEKRAGQLRDALNEINAAINSTLDFDEIMQAVVVEAAKAIGCHTASIEIRRDGYWEVRYLYGLPHDMIGMRLSLEEAKCLEIAARTGKPYFINGEDISGTMDKNVVDSFGIQSMMLIPIVMKGEMVAALRFVGHSSSVTFTEPQVDFATKLAASVSLALENARLFELEVEAQRQARYELELSNLLLKAADTLAESIDLNQVLESLADIVLDVTGRRRIGIYLLDEKTYELEAKAARGESVIPVGSKFILKQLAPQFQSVVYGKQSRVIDYESSDIAEENRQRAKAMNIKVALLVPLLYKGDVLGILALDNPGERQDVTGRDIELVEGIAAQAAVAIENARLYEAERHIADTLQEALLTVPESINGLGYGYMYRSATEGTKVGGDLYDLFELGDGRVGITLGDVSGKGLKAASLTAVVRNTIRAYALDGHCPSEIMAKTNDAVRLASGQASFITVFFAVLDITTGKLTYCSAGHPPAILHRATGVELLEGHSPIIGAFENMCYTKEETYINKGDCLVLYTDGITEARCDREFYGEDRLIDFLSKAKQVSAKEIPHAIYNDVVTYSGGKLLDDVAILAVSLTDETRA